MPVWSNFVMKEDSSDVVKNVLDEKQEHNYIL